MLLFFSSYLKNNKHVTLKEDMLEEQICRVLSGY